MLNTPANKRSAIRWARHAPVLLLLALLSSGLPARARAQEGGGTAEKDEPTNITFGHMFKEGEVNFSDVDAVKVAPMPPGYASYRNEGFKVKITAVVSGPNVADFAVRSVSDPAVFGNLRVLCSDWD